MKLSLITLAILPVVQGEKLAYHVPPTMMLMAQQSESCVFPAGYQIKDFVGATNNTATQALSSFNFTFEDPSTKVNTICHLNSSSVSTTTTGYTPRYNCENSNIRFIWTEGRKEILLIEGICPGNDGTPSFEVSGGQVIDFSCQDPCKCITGQATYDAKYYSIKPWQTPQNSMKQQRKSRIARRDMN